MQNTKLIINGSSRSLRSLRMTGCQAKERGFFLQTIYRLVKLTTRRPVSPSIVFPEINPLVGFEIGATCLQLKITTRRKDPARSSIKSDFGTSRRIRIPSLPGENIDGDHHVATFQYSAPSILRILSKVQMKFPFKTKPARNYPRHEVALSIYSRKAEFAGTGKPFHYERKRERDRQEEREKKISRRIGTSGRFSSRTNQS